MSEYRFNEIEKKWQKKWYSEGTFNAKDDKTLPKFYGLIEFPYPSGQGLHVGHPRSNTALDIICRKRRMEGYNVLFPIGWDAFGLPAENFAIKNKIHPKIITEKNIKHFREQLQSLGFSFDYSREVNTTDPNYYKWTQWIFLKLYEHGLAYKAEAAINFCTGCKVGLANEEVVGGVCERCGSPVVRKVKSQWMLKITDYAERLINDLDDLDFIEKVKIQQKNWIGRSEGAEVYFSIANSDEKLKIYTTRPDTMFGATYMVVSPEHPIIKNMANKIQNIDEVQKYQDLVAHKSDFERAEINKEKTGVELKGIKAINPANGKEIPVWTSDYVLMSYGTGAIMAVPAHDERDFEFAKKFKLPIVRVISENGELQNSDSGNELTEPYVDVYKGVMINSSFLNGLKPKDAIAKMIEHLELKGIGNKKVNYKLRDWLFSRQRYWGEPIPMVHCDKCGWVPLPESELPLVLPDVEDFMPGENGESPLARIKDWVNTTCPKCGGKAERETDTMPQWAGSSWYFLRYVDPHNDKELASKEELEYWCPVDWYNGGMEHTTLHLLYSRFWHKFLYDIGVVPTKEPYQKRTSHGMILGENGEKMSKSRGNVINPDDIVRDYGADTLRLYEMFIGAFDQPNPWSQQGVKGCKKFLDRVWKLQEIVTLSKEHSKEYSKELETSIHKLIKKVSEDVEKMKFNTAIAAMMSFINQIYSLGKINEAELKVFLILLYPFVPHITSELWEQLKFEGFVYEQKWPKYDPQKAVDEEVEIAVQVNGKLRDTVKVSPESEQAEVRELVVKSENVKKFIDGKEIVKEIYVKGRIYNIVVK